MEKILLTLVDQVGGIATHMLTMQNQIGSMQQQMDSMQNQLRATDARVSRVETNLLNVMLEQRKTKEELKQIYQLASENRDYIKEVEKNKQAIQQELNTITEVIMTRLDQHDRNIYENPPKN